MKYVWWTFWGWVAMLAIRRLGYQGMAPIEINEQWFLILVPDDVSLPQGEEGHDNDCVGDNNEAS